MPFAFSFPPSDDERPRPPAARAPDPRSAVPAPPLPRPSAVLDERELFVDRNSLISRRKALEKRFIPQSDVTVPSEPSATHYANLTPSSLSAADPTRPQSALHQGIFTNDARRTPLPGSPPVAVTRHLFREHSAPGSVGAESSPTAPPPFSLRVHTAPRVRPASLGSSFILKPPTSPLVHSSNGEIDFSTPPPLLSLSPSSSTHAADDDDLFLSKAYRRRSLPPGASTFSTTSARSPLSSSPSPSLPFGSFVGSYEESILNGRMSTLPSKPLTFLAQIGVLGLGKCKPALRCPAHVSLPFSAYFYAVGDWDSPSPYVGQIDLDALAAAGKKRRQDAAAAAAQGLGGCYRIPQRGQLQIVIKNANKTAVKLYLVPYDLREMEPGTKTFIRQKSYVIPERIEDDHHPLAAPPAKDPLRYLIHLHIACPSRGRYYLHRSIRVVFANRVPDGKERLRNELLWPEPKFSAWKPEPSSGAATPTLQQRQRSKSLYGAVSKRSTPPPPVPLFNAGTAARGIGSGGVRETETTRGVDSTVGSYEKMDIVTNTPPREGALTHGLLTRRLRELEVDKDAAG